MRLTEARTSAIMPIVLYVSCDSLPALICCLDRIRQARETAKASALGVIRDGGFALLCVELGLVLGGDAGDAR